MGYPKIDEVYDGRYRIVRRIGHGGMGVVYEAVDQVLNRSVALKIVLPSLPDRDDFHARFAREASVLARIRSRHIVGIHEYGEHDDTVYFVTELFPDGDLRSWLAQRGPLDRRAALSLVAQVCEALADAHAAGIIHRDVKPGNVLLWSRPEGLIPYLCDFGIALDGNAENQQGLTRAGALVGSPAYMAPERHFGHAADERGDVYSAGCLLWAALTGDAPYSGTDFQMINSHINSPIPHLGTGDPVDDRIDELLAAALHKDPEQRIPSAVALRGALLALVREIDAAGRRVPAPAPARPAPTPREPAPTPQPDRTIIRDSPVLVPVPAEPPHIEPPAEPPADPRLPADPLLPEPGPATGRRRGLLVAAAAVLVAGIALTGYLVSRDPTDSDPTVTPEPSDSPSPSTSQTVEPLDTPAAPVARARPGYRSVAFLLERPDAVVGIDQRVEYDDGSGWAPARHRLRVPTEQGGDRTCIRLRTVVHDDQGQAATSEPGRSCGRAAPRTVRLVRTADSCADTINGFDYPCQWYGVVATGFATGATPLARLRPVDETEYCADFDCQRLTVGKDGRASLTHYFKIFRDSGVYVLDLDGVQTRARLYYR
jgi:serine/threonine protein kinase